MISSKPNQIKWFLVNQLEFPANETFSEKMRKLSVSFRNLFRENKWSENAKCKNFDKNFR